MSTFDTLIVPEDLSVEAVAKLAESMGVSSVCRGIPPRLEDLLSADDLPTVYTETVEESTDANGIAVETRALTFDDTVIATELVAVEAALAAEAEVVTDPEETPEEPQPE